MSSSLESKNTSETSSKKGGVVQLSDSIEISSIKQLKFAPSAPFNNSIDQLEGCIEEYEG